MNILHISTIREWRGGDKQMLTTHEILRDFPDINQVIVCPQNSILSEKCKDLKIPVYTAPRNSKLSIPFLKQIYKAIKNEKIDIVHVHDSNALSLTLMVLNFTPKVKLIYSRKRNNRVKPGFFKNLKYNNPAISQIVCVSKAVKEVLVPVVKDSGKIQVIYDGIDLEKFSEDNSNGQLRKEYHLKEDALLIGNIAGLTRQKDLFTFLDAAKIILDKTPQPVYFIIIGEGPLEKQLEEYAGSLKISQNVIFSGFKANIPELLPEFDLFMISSETEGLPLSVLEAFACKVPVVATTAGGTGEAVIHEKTGMISPVKDAASLAENARRVLEDSQLKETLVENAFKLVHEKFSLEVMQKNYYELYTKI